MSTSVVSLRVQNIITLPLKTKRSFSWVTFPLGDEVNNKSLTRRPMTTKAKLGGWRQDNNAMLVVLVLAV